MTIIAIILLIISGWMFYHKRKGDRQEYATWKKAWDVFTGAALRYYLVGTPAKVTIIGIRAVVTIYELGAFSIPIVRAGVRASQGGDFWNVFIECQIDGVSQVLTGIAIVTIGLMVIIYQLCNRYESKTGRKILDKIDEGLDLLKNLFKIQTADTLSRALEMHRSKIGKSHVERKETHDLLVWAKAESEPKKSEKRITLLLGAAGSGKSVIMKDVFMALRDDKKCEVVALKSDILYDDEDSKSLDERTNLGKPIIQYIAESAKKQRIVLIVDQIDALSIVLSSHRKPLEEIMNLVLEASKIQNVRIVVSCRKYDFNYDQSFAELHDSNKIAVGGLAIEEVQRVLQENNIETDGMSDELKQLLTNPLNLSLYCKTKPDLADKDIRTLTDLYDCLWDNVLDDYRRDTKEIVEFLWTFVQKLYQRQTLSIRSQLISSEWHRVGKYLLSRGIIIENNGVWQFMHQTLFDYVFARLFFEKNQTLKDMFESNHQGLFVRNQLKQVLDYQRAVDLDGFLGNVKKILLGMTKDGSRHAYRFHIRHLVLSMLGSYEQLSPEEIALIERHIFTDSLYQYHFAISTITMSGFNVYKQWIDNNGGFFSIDKTSQQNMLTMIYRIIYDKKQEMLQYIQSICTPQLSDNYRKQLINMIDRMGKVEMSKELLTVTDFLDTNEEEIVFSSLMHSNINYVDWVSERVLKSICAIYKNHPKEGLLFYPNIPHEVSMLYDDLKQKFPKKAYNVAYDIVRYVAELSVEELKEDIKQSHAYWTFNRQNAMTNHFHEEIVDDMMDYLEGCANDMDDDEYALELDKLTKTDLAILHVVASAAMAASVDKHERYVYEYLKTHISRVYHYSSLRYYHVQLFGAWVKVNQSPEALGELIAIILTIHPEWEKVAMPYKNRELPLTRIGYTQSQYFACVPEELLKQYPDAFKVYRECKEKYKTIDTEEPNRAVMQIGDKSIETEAMDHIKDIDEFLSLMRAYNKDSIIDFEKPSLTGVSRDIASRVPSNPDFFYALFEKALPDKKVHIMYCMDGLEAFIDMGYDKEKIDAFYIRLIREALSRPESEQPARNLTLCRYCDYYTKRPRKHMPREVFDFVKSVVLHPTSDVDEAEDIDYNMPINRERGRAISVLIESYYDEEYAAEIFPTLFAILPEASVTSKVGMLFEMAVLMNIDRAMTLDLFLAVTKDYNHNYFTLPIHDWNPLPYLIHTHFADLIPYFTAAINCERGNDTTANLLLRAWLLGYENAKPMLITIADKSPAARVQLIEMVARNCNRDNINKMYEILLRYLTYGDEDLGRRYDDVFDELEKWKSFFPTKEYLQQFLESDMGLYCSHDIYHYLKSLANNDPNYCLSFISMLYNKKVATGKLKSYELGEITGILIAAYNNVRIYDKDNDALEKAMDMLDELLEKENVNHYLNQCLKEMDE